MTAENQAVREYLKNHADHGILRDPPKTFSDIPGGCFQKGKAIPLILPGSVQASVCVQRKYRKFFYILTQRGQFYDIISDSEFA